MSSPRAQAVDPREHALRTLAQFLTRYGPVRSAQAAPSSPCPDADGADDSEQPAACGSAPSPFDPLVRRPGGDDDELPRALSA